MSNIIEARVSMFKSWLPRSTCHLNSLDRPVAATCCECSTTPVQLYVPCCLFVPKNKQKCLQDTGNGSNHNHIHS